MRTPKCLLLIIAFALCAGQASASPLPSTSIALGEKFWAPYGTAEQTCASRLTIVYYDDLYDGNPVPGAQAWTYVGAGDCVIHVWAQASDTFTRPQLCSVVAHEIGHNTFGLDHDAGGIMRAVDPPIPAVCRPRVAKRSRLSRRR